MSERYEEINLLYSISEILGSVISLREAAATILREVAEVLGVVRAALWVFDPETESLDQIAWVGEQNQPARIGTDDARSVTAAVFRDRQSIILEPSDEFPRGEPKVEAEFFAGWIALTKLRNPAQADRHFAELQNSSSTPITQGRAAYWRGRAAEARGDTAAAQQFYQQGARYITVKGDAELNAIVPSTMLTPTLVLFGERDPGVRPEDAARLFARLGTSDKQLVVLPGADHAAQLEDTHDAWIATVAAFIKRHVAGAK